MANKRTGAHRLDERDLPQHLINPTNNVSGFTDFTQDEEARLFEHGEDILAGNAVNIDSSKIMFNASSALSDGLPATAIAIDGGLTGASSSVVTSDVIEALAAGFDVNEDVWLTVPDVDGRNVSTNKPQALSGTIVQHLGRSIDTTTYVSAIGPPETIK